MLSAEERRELTLLLRNCAAALLGVDPTDPRAMRLAVLWRESAREADRVLVDGYGSIEAHIVDHRFRQAEEHYERPHYHGEEEG